MSSPPPSPDNRFLALRHAGQEATDFTLPDQTVHRFVELRDRGADRAQIESELGLPDEVVAALVKADEAWAVAHRIAEGQEPMYPVPEPSEQVVDTRSGSSRVPLLVVLVVLVAAIAYGLLR